MGKITEGRQSLPETPKAATQFDGEQPDTKISVSPKRKFDYSPKPKHQIGDSGKG